MLRISMTTLRLAAAAAALTGAAVGAVAGPSPVHADGAPRGEVGFTVAPRAPVSIAATPQAIDPGVTVSFTVTGYRLDSARTSRFGSRSSGIVIG